MVNHSSSLIWLKSKELRNLSIFFTYATVLQLLVSYAVLYVYVHDYASDVCVHTNTVSTNTVPDTPSGATSTVQDATASPAEHSKQGIRV